jgi:polyisoprenoid-binding protein YceI
MSRTPFSTAFCLTVALLVAGPARAERKPWVPDRSHSQLNFVGEALLISAHGFFEKWEIDAQLDPAGLENSTVSLTIDAASLNTRVARRDSHLRSPDFFDVAKYPEIKFVSKSVKKLDDKNVTLVGDLTLRGVTKTVEIPVRVVFLRDGDARFKGELQINRRDFGMTYNSRMNPVEDMVSVQFDMHLLDKAVQEERQRQAPQKTGDARP